MQSHVEKWIAVRNAIHFCTRIANLECNSFKKDFDDACTIDFYLYDQLKYVMVTFACQSPMNSKFIKETLGCNDFWGQNEISVNFGRSREKREVFLLKGAFHNRRAPLLAGWVPYLPLRAPSWAKRALFMPEGRLHWREGRHICLCERRHGQMGAFCARRAPALVEGAP